MQLVTSMTQIFHDLEKEKSTLRTGHHSTLLKKTQPEGGKTESTKYGELSMTPALIGKEPNLQG